MPVTGKDLLSIIREHLNLNDYRKVHWEGKNYHLPRQEKRT